MSEQKKRVSKKTSKKSKKSSKKASGEKRVKRMGLPETQVSRLIKFGAGASLKKARVSKKVVEAVKRHVESWLREVGMRCHHILELKKSNTVKADTLKHTFMGKLECHPWIKHSIDIGAIKLNDKETMDEKKYARISKGPAVRVFSKDIKGVRVSGEAKRAIKALTEAKIKYIGMKMAIFTKNSGRETVQLKDFDSFVELRCF